jgi:hypothetical protein
MPPVGLIISAQACCSPAKLRAPLQAVAVTPVKIAARPTAVSSLVWISAKRREAQCFLFDFCLGGTLVFEGGLLAGFAGDFFAGAAFFSTAAAFCDGAGVFPAGFCGLATS